MGNKGEIAGFRTSDGNCPVICDDCYAHEVDISDNDDFDKCSVYVTSREDSKRANPECPHRILNNLTVYSEIENLRTRLNKIMDDIFESKMNSPILIEKMLEETKSIEIETGRMNVIVGLINDLKKSIEQNIPQDKILELIPNLVFANKNQKNNLDTD